jgi:hypothetical protein
VAYFIELKQQGGAMAQPVLDDWRAESIRFSYFFAEELPDALRKDLWRAITGAEPQSSTTRPAEGVVQDQGIFLDGQLTVVVAINRLDVILVGQVKGAAEFPNLGVIASIHSSFHQAVDNALGGAEAAAIRLAYGLTITRLSKDRNDSYDTLDKLLSNVNVSAESRDFFYQINHPRQSVSDSSITINRISRWSAVVLKQLSLDASPSGPEVHAVRVEFDFNTAPETNASGANKQTLMAELISDAHTMLTRGDRDGD